MNENPEGPPNPLNPNPAPTGDAPVSQPSGLTIDPIMKAPATNAPATEAPAPEAPANPGLEPIGQTPIGVGSDASSAIANESVPADVIAGLAPVDSATAGTPEQSSVAPKKSKKGVIILCVFLILVAIGCGVAALLILNPFGGGDRFPAAIEKVLKNGISSNLAVNGTITVSNTSEYSDLSDLNITLDAQFDLANKTNTAKAGINAILANDTSLEFDAEEILNKDGDIFVKLDGISDAYGSLQSGLTTQVTTNKSCLSDDSNTAMNDGEVVTNCDVLDEVSTACEGETCSDTLVDTTSEVGSLGTIIKMLKSIDGEWIRIPASVSTSSEQMISANIPTQCISDAMGKLPSYGDSLVETYKQNQFLDYSSENVGIPAVKDTIYRVKINSSKLAGFIDAIKGGAFASELLSCFNETSTSSNISGEQIAKLFDNYPTIYVEIDENYKFTRLVLDGGSDYFTAKADFRLSYPQSVTITEPAEYIEVDKVVQSVIKDIYGISTVDTPDGTTINPYDSSSMLPVDNNYDGTHKE